MNKQMIPIENVPQIGYKCLVCYSDALFNDIASKLVATKHDEIRFDSRFQNMFLHFGVPFF